MSKSKEERERDFQEGLRLGREWRDKANQMAYRVGLPGYPEKPSSSNPDVQRGIDKATEKTRWL